MSVPETRHEAEAEMERGDELEREVREVLGSNWAMYDPGGMMSRILTRHCATPKQREAIRWLRNDVAGHSQFILRVIADFARQCYTDNTDDINTDPLEIMVRETIEGGW